MIDLANPSFDPIALKEEFEAWALEECMIDVSFFKKVKHDSMGKLVYSFLVNTKKLDDQKSKTIPIRTQAYYLIQNLLQLWYPNKD